MTVGIFGYSSEDSWKVRQLDAYLDEVEERSAEESRAEAYWERMQEGDT